LRTVLIVLSVNSESAQPKRITFRAIASATLIAGLVVAAGGCVPARVGVLAVARGAKAAAPFFDEALGLGFDAAVSEDRALEGGSKRGDQPGLYGGSRRRKTCDKAKLIDFLDDPSHRDRAREWAGVQGIDVKEISIFVKRLTPVVLRNDTLVKNHDFKKGKAFPYDALLQAGVAVLVDRRGRPVVKCSCGNPLGSFEHDAGSADVRFKGKGKKWKYNPRKIIKIEPVDEDRPVESYQLLDISGNTGLSRPAGSDGEHDKGLRRDPGEAAVPDPEPSETPIPELSEIPSPFDPETEPAVPPDAAGPPVVTDGPVPEVDHS
jgi:hypothetical protein